jgi:predicted metal-dependent phosphoesterase TrpH
MIGAIEALNARATLQSQNDKALLFAKERGLAMVAGSDAHHASEIGAAYVEFSGVKLLDADAIANAKRRLCGGRSSPFVRLHSRLASMRKRFGWHGKVCGQTFSAL